MSYVCDELDGTVSQTGSQGCAVWVESFDFASFAVTKEQAQDLGLAFGFLCIVVFVYKLLRKII